MIIARTVLSIATAIPKCHLGRLRVSVSTSTLLSKANSSILLFNPLNPHDASKHHFASVKNDLTSYTSGFENNFHRAVLIITTYFLQVSPNSGNFHPLQVENCDSNSRLVVDENYKGKFKLERVNKRVLLFAIVCRAKAKCINCLLFK